jgi:DNA polymerase-1
MEGRLMLVDRSSYIYRAFHALPSSTTSHGESSGAVYGVVSTLRRLQQEASSKDKIIVILDSPTPTFRHKLYPD